MKKLFKKFDKKIMISVIAILAMISTFMIYQIYAATITKEMTSTGTGMANGEEGAEGSLYQEDLTGRYDILCASEGTFLPSNSSGSYSKYTVESVETASPMEAYILAEMVNDISGFTTSDIVFETDSTGNKVEFTDIDRLSTLETISFNDQVIYVIKTQQVENENGMITDEQNGVGNEKFVMQDTDGKYYYVSTVSNSGYLSHMLYSYVQRAWWNTEAGSKGNAIPPNELSTEAEQFEAYINQFGESEIVEQTIVDENGNTKVVPAPKIDFAADFNQTNPTVSWDAVKQQYLIGPFSIHYVEAASTSTGREQVMFSGISNVELYTDASSEPLALGDGWNFHWQNRDSEDTTLYPHTNEEFYIRLDYKELATKITNIKFEFQYMNAGGKYEVLEGKYYTPTASGWIERVSQSLTGGLIGARWYEKAELNWEPDINYGKIKIIKNIVNSEGNLTNSFDQDRYFTFKVTVGDSTEYVTVKAGSSANSNLYTWYGDNAPTYTVEEIQEDGYELVEIKNASGVLSAEPQNGPVEVIATNRIVNKGNLRIVKKITTPSVNNQEFKIDVKVFGNFQYQGTSYENKTLTIPVILTIPAGSTRAEATLTDFIWNDSDAPKYSVTEDRNHNTAYELKAIHPKKGTLKADQTVSITVINERIKEKAKLHIIKTLEGADKFTDEYIKSLEFTFKISVSGYESYTVTLKPIRKDNQYIWEYESDYYYFEESEVLLYKIEEINVPEGTEFVTASSEDSSVTVLPNGIQGGLRDLNQDLRVTNYIVNKVTDPDKGTLKITKKINTDTLANKEYSFNVNVTGTFDYEGNHYENTTMSVPVKITVPAGATEANIQLSEFSWYGEAPEYTVEENMSGLDGVQSIINPKEGSLRKDTTVEVIAENSLESKKGTLHIIKTLENANQFSDEYIKSLVFSFKITVADVDYGVVTLQPEKVNNTYIWEYTADYTWNAINPNPTYTIEEVNLPEGTEFVSANGTSENKVTGTLKPDSEEDYVIKNEFINKLKMTSGYLKIDKKVTSGSLEGKTFTFNAKIKGTFEYNGVVYTNTTMDLNNIAVAGGSTWTSGEIRWYGDNAPTYVVEEQESSFATLESVINSSGTLVAGGTAEAQVATFTNSAKTTSGSLQITKKLQAGASSDEIFYFDIAVEGYETYTVGIKAGETYRSEAFKWNAGENAPTYKVTEHASSTSKMISMSNDTGSLVENEIISIVCENKIQEHKGKLKVTKEVIVDEKLQADAIDAEFTIYVIINGTFEMNNESVVDSTRMITETLKAGEYFETEIKWYGDKAPTYTVTETSIPTGWKLENISNAEGKFLKDQTAESIVTNSLSTRVELDLTIELAGHVWEDIRVENKEQEQVQTYGIQGIYDEKLEQGIDGVEVYIYKVIYDANNREISRELGTAYEEDSNETLTFPLYTNNGGYWSSPRMCVPVLTAEQKANNYKAAYDVEFIYDGQTYEPTNFLTTSNGDPNAYRAASTSNRDKWAKDSMALDYNREEVDNRIAQVQGNTEIDGQGNTVGKVVDLQGNETAIYYEATEYSEGLTSSRKISELQTIDQNGNIYDLYKTKARTSMGGLTYPFDSKYHLESVDKYIDDLGVVERYKYTATYNYTLNINLGLLKREEADIGTTKDLYSAKVIVNGKALNYRFNTLADLTGTTISRQLKADDMNISYQLGLYKTDYYYRTELYQTSGKMYDAVETFYKSLGKNVEATELDVYLTYKIKVFNESPNYIVSINGLNDYFDSSFGKPITEVETKYIETLDGVTVDSVTEVANKSYVETSSGNRFDVNWQIAETNINGSDGIKYNKMVADFGTDRLRLASGEKAEITVTFKVQKDDIDGVKDAVILGQKANVAEVASYSTYYAQNGKIAGKIDRDSAPANTNIEEYNERSWYEDDTDSAPILNLSLSGEERQIDGVAWEDKQDSEFEGQKVGNGKYDNGEALIGGLTTQLVEKVMVKTSDTQYTEYDFVWPTNRALDVLGGRTLESLTGFDSTIETSRTQAPETEANGLALGEYRFENIPVGNYVVRFLYGNDKTELEDSEGITGDPQALKLDAFGNVVSYSENENILTANYDQKLEGKTPSVYNGHDYKTTTYQAGVANTNADGYVNNEWHNLNLGEERLSDARDSEAKRLETIAKSTTITNVNGSVLATANDITANRTDLYKDYNMFADTAKINLTIEDIDTAESEKQNGVDIKVIKGTILNDGVVTTENLVYGVKNIDVGLEERPETNLVLDKQVSSIKLITSDGRSIFNAEYDISYEEISKPEYELGKYTKILEKDDTYVVAKVSLNTNSIGTDVLQAINKEENKDQKLGTQNFRFINVDEAILQGSTIEVNYQLTALNMSEIDRIDEKLQAIKEIKEPQADGTVKTITVEEQLLKVAEEIKKNNVTYTKSADGKMSNHLQIGTYLGTTYYQGTSANGRDKVVTAKVRQLVDYVDNDAVFTATDNNGIDSSWRNVSINEITGNGIDANRLINKDIITENNIKDKAGVFYITSQKNNLIVSVDSTQDTEVLTNKGFIVDLVPYNAYNAEDASTQYMTKMNLKTARTIAAESDADSLAFDNLAEIVKYEIATGRRDLTSTPGNANPSLGEFNASIDERDSSATELVTLTPPTGIGVNVELTLQILGIVVIALAIIAVGVVIIKKKVLSK